MRSIGAAHVVDYTTEDFTDGRARYDVILDNVGNRPLSRLRRASDPDRDPRAQRRRLTRPRVRAGGRHPSGGRGQRVSSGSGSDCSRTNRSGSNLLTLTGLIEAGKLTPVLDRTYPLADTAEGLRHVEQGHARGKVVITVA